MDEPGSGENGDGLMGEAADAIRALVERLNTEHPWDYLTKRDEECLKLRADLDAARAEVEEHRHLKFTFDTLLVGRAKRAEAEVERLQAALKAELEGYDCHAHEYRARAER